MVPDSTFRGGCEGSGRSFVDVQGTGPAPPGLRTPGRECCLGGGTQEWGEKECLTGPAQVFQVVVWTCWDLCQLSWLVLAPSADLWKRGSCLPSPAPSIQWWGSSPEPLHTAPPCPSQLLLSLAMGTRSHMDSPTLTAPGSKIVWSHQRFKPPSGSRGPRSSRGSVRVLELGGRAGSLHRENRTAPVWWLLRAWRGTCSLPSGHTSLIRPGEAHVHGSC